MGRGASSCGSAAPRAAVHGLSASYYTASLPISISMGRGASREQLLFSGITVPLLSPPSMLQQNEQSAKEQLP